MIPTKQSISQAHQRIKKYIHKTPLLTCSTINSSAGTKSLFFKCENLQKIGAFKARGACNKMLKLNSDIKSVCTHSSGNHAMALAYMGKELGFKAYVVMPENSPALKKKSVESYGATIVISGNTVTDRERVCLETCQKYNAALVHAYNDYELIEGQATCAKEIFDEMPNHFDYVLFPIGGGGLGSGTLLSTKYFGGKCVAIGVEPELAGDAYLSMRDKKIHPQFPPVSVADGLRVNLGEKPFSIMQEHLPHTNIILVTEREIIEATQLVLERMKMVIEPSSATVVAGLLKDKRFTGKNVCCIISGGNIDMSAFFEGLKAKL